MLKTILFDMDGVLVDVSRSYRRAIQETAAHFTGRDIPAGTIQRYKNLGGFNDDWKLTHSIISNTGIKVSFARVVDTFQKYYRGDNWNGLITEERALIRNEVLEQLKGHVNIMGVVTGRPKEEAQWAIEHFGWNAYLPLLVPRERHERRPKPDPYPLQHALAVLDAIGRTSEPDEAVYIGDTVDDMVAARAAGMWAVGVVPPYLDAEEHEAILRDRGAHVVLHDVNELPQLITNFRVRVMAPETDEIIAANKR